MRKYTFELIHKKLPGFKEIDHVIPAQSLTDAMEKFARKHELDTPAYWDEPSYEKWIEVSFKNERGAVKYRISW